MAKVASYKSFRLSDVVSLIRESWGHGVLFGLLVAAAVLVVSVSIPFYFKIGGFVGYLLAAVLFWAAAIVALSLQWFLPSGASLAEGSQFACASRS
jgi:Mg/Co/Ni transporter MgtE